MLQGQARRLSDLEPVATERRAVPRVEPRSRLDAKIMAAVPARVLDISSRGALIEVARVLQPLRRCDLRIQFPEGEFAVRAIVRRCRAWGFGVDDESQRVMLYRAGLEFEEVAPEYLARLSASLLFQV